MTSNTHLDRDDDVIDLSILRHADEPAARKRAADEENAGQIEEGGIVRAIDQDGRSRHQRVDSVGPGKLRRYDQAEIRERWLPTT